MDINDITKHNYSDNFDDVDYSTILKIPMNYEHNVLGYGQNQPHIFRKELLSEKIYDTFIACEKGYRTGTTRKERYKENTLFLITAKSYDYCLLAIITKSSYKVNTISQEKWSKLEGWDISYFKKNPQVSDKYQFTFKIIKKVYI